MTKADTQIREKKVTLTIRRGADCWLVQSSDPSVNELFGTDTLPTPFTLEADCQVVLARIRELNPEADCSIEGLRYDTRRAVGQEVGKLAAVEKAGRRERLGVLITALQLLGVENAEGQIEKAQRIADRVAEREDMGITTPSVLDDAVREISGYYPAVWEFVCEGHRGGGMWDVGCGMWARPQIRARRTPRKRFRSRNCAAGL